MEGSGTRFASTEDLGAPPDSWEVADLDASMQRLMFSSSKEKDSNAYSSSDFNSQFELRDATDSDLTGSDDQISNLVDQFLREAIQNPRERLSVLRMEQDIEKFVKDRTRQEMVLEQIPTSYLRLAAHRLAQHYSLQSMVSMDNAIPDGLGGPGSKIIITKTSGTRMPLIRLADIPVNLPDNGAAFKVAIKQRPQKGSHNGNSSNSQSSRSNGPKSVEERKEEYNRARARIFNSNSSGNGGANGKPAQSFGVSRHEEKYVQGGGASDANIGRGSGLSSGLDSGSVDLSAGSSRPVRSRTEKEPIGRSKSNNRVAIFRDREIDRKDPDYDRRYDRYMQRFDPGFGFSDGSYSVQPMYAPAVNYNTEFPQLGAVHGPPDHQPGPLPQHLPGPGPWAASSGIGYGPQFNPNHVGYLHSAAQYAMPYIHPHEQVHQAFTQSHQQQPDTSFGLARPR